MGELNTPASLPPLPPGPERLPPGVSKVQVAAARIEPFLSKTPLLARCDPAIISKIAPHFIGLECQPGSVVIAAGAPTEGIGVLFSGRLSVHLPDGQVAEVLEAGDHFGDAALLLAGASPYSVVAAEHCRVLWLRGEVTQSMLGKIPSVGEALGRRLAAQVARLCGMQRPALPELGAGPQLAVPAAAEPPSSKQIPFVELSELDLQPSALNLLPSKLIRMHRLLPVRLQEDRLTVAMVQPRNQAALTDLHRTLPNVNLDVVAISADDFVHAVVRLKLDPASSPSKSSRQGAGINPDSLIFEAAAAEAERDTGPASRTVGDDVIRFANRIIASALDRDSSDIHLEPTVGGGARVRFRVNGLLQEWSEPIPPQMVKPVTARIKVLAGLDITERRLPQDGRIGFTTGKREVDLRVSTLPANRGEKLVLRILEAGNTKHLEQIFVEPHTVMAVQRALQRPYGGIIVGGPTSSGKSTTVYGLLRERMTIRPDNNLITVEDPIEYRMAGVSQVQVNPAAGLGFAQVLRAMLRQDPDTIVVGETRDSETAVLALEAAMTGHLLITTLHANDSLTCLQRLETLGCSAALLSQSIALVLVQRLVRRLCANCKRLEQAPAALLETLISRKIVDPAQAAAGLPRPVGCESCNGTGYVGRIVVCEALQITDDVKNALAGSRPLPEVQQVALQTGALMPFWAYSSALLQRQLVSPAEVLLSVVE